jgi:hypothetical protein
MNTSNTFLNFNRSNLTSEMQQLEAKHNVSLDPITSLFYLTIDHLSTFNSLCYTVTGSDLIVAPLAINFEYSSKVQDYLMVMYFFSMEEVVKRYGYDYDIELGLLTIVMGDPDVTRFTVGISEDKLGEIWVIDHDGDIAEIPRKVADNIFELCSLLYRHTLNNSHLSARVQHTTKKWGEEKWLLLEVIPSLVNKSEMVELNRENPRSPKNSDGFFKFRSFDRVKYIETQLKNSTVELPMKYKICLNYIHIDTSLSINVKIADEFVAIAPLVFTCQTPSNEVKTCTLDTFYDSDTMLEAATKTTASALNLVEIGSIKEDGLKIFVSTHKDNSDEIFIGSIESGQAVGLVKVANHIFELLRDTEVGTMDWERISEKQINIDDLVKFWGDDYWTLTNGKLEYAERFTYSF